MQQQLKTRSQIKAIFGLAKQRGIDMDADTKMGFAITVSLGRTDSLADLRFDEANRLIENLGGDAFPPFRRPRRTESYHRQKAGIEQIAQTSHLRLMNELAVGRGMSADGLERMGRRMLKHWPPHTTAETNKIIEALKAMNKRDRNTGRKEAA